MKSCVEDFAPLVRDPNKLLRRLLRETRTLSKPIDLADLETGGVNRKEGEWYRVPNQHDLPERVAKRIQEMLWEVQPEKPSPSSILLLSPGLRDL